MINQNDITVQGSTAWKNHRRNCITATDISKIIGINPWCTALKLWNQKLGLELQQQENESMRRGSELEPIALTRFIQEVGIVLYPEVVFHSVDKWKMASLDGLSRRKWRAVEIKCSQKIYEKAKQGIIDDIYRCQMNWQMYCLDMREMYFAAYWDGDMIIIEIKRDDDFLNEIMPKIHEFYRCMMDFTPPPATDHDFVKRDSKEWRIHAEIWKQTKAEIKLLEAKEECLRNELIDMCDGQSSQGNGIRVSKCLKKGIVDYSSIECLKSVNLDDYRKKPTQYYRISENET